MITHSEFNDALHDMLDYLYPWEKESRIDFRFAALNQWDKEDVDKLTEEGRPALVFDRTRPILASVSGAEITTRHEPKYLPRDADLGDVDVYYSEAGSKVYKWIRDRGDFEHHESAAFQSALICGVGCTEMYMDYEHDKDGMLKLRRVPIWEVGWDPASVEPNLGDARHLIRDRWIDEDEIVQRFGRELLDHVIALGGTDVPGRTRGFLARIFAREQDDPRQTYFEQRAQKYYDPRRRRVRLWEMLRKDRIYMTRILMPEVLGGGDQFVTPKETQEALEMIRTAAMTAQMEQSMQAAAMGIPEEQPDPATMGVDYVEDFPVTKVFRSYHAGNEVIKEEELPLSDFPYQFITAFEDFKDPERRYFFGLMRTMRDPQKYANKFFSHAVHMWASNPKGSLMYEEDLFEDEEEFKSEWAKSTGAIRVGSGKLQSPNPKWVHLANSVNLTGIETLLQHAVMSVSAAAGVSEQYTVGTPQDLRRTAASAVQSVKESNLVTISQPFDALRLFKRTQGRLVLDFVANYVPISQLTRLLGPEEQEFIPALKDGKLQDQYEVVVEESPASKSKQMEIFAKIMETNFIPQLMEIGVPIPPSLAKYFPFPPDINTEFEGVLIQTKEIMEMQAQLQQMQMQMEMMQMQMMAEQGPEAAPGEELPPEEQGEAPPEEQV